MSAVVQERSRALVRAIQLGILALVIGGWEVGARTGVLDTFFFSQPSAFLGRVWEWLVSGENTMLGGRTIYQHIAVTLEEMIAAFVIGVVFGVSSGFALGRSRFWSRVFNPYIQVLNALPRLVLAPIFVLLLGIGEASKIALGVSLVFFIAFFNAYQGVRDVDPRLVDNARMLGATDRQLTRYVLLPSAMTWIFSSLHTSVGFALVGAVVGEYMAAARGLGWVISQAQGNFDSAGVFAGMTILCMIVIVVEIGVSRLERRLLAWKPSRSGELLAA